MKKVLIVIAVIVVIAVTAWLIYRSKKNKLIDAIMSYKNKVPNFDAERSVLEKKSLAELRAVLADLQSRFGASGTGNAAGGAGIVGNAAPNSGTPDTR